MQGFVEVGLHSWMISRCGRRVVDGGVKLASEL